MGGGSQSNVSFVLLAEFHINEGSILPYQYPFPTGTDDQLLAELMIPDGAHFNAEDWTYFFLNQSPANTIAPVFSDTHANDENASEPTEQPLLYVLNLVKTKKDAAAPRGGWVKALAICTRHPFVDVFKNALLKTLDEFFANPSVEVLAGLYDAINAMDLSQMPVLTRNEKLILRTSDRRDFFYERFIQGAGRRPSDAIGSPTSEHEAGHHHTNGRSKFDLVDRSTSPYPQPQSPSRSERSGSMSSGRSSPVNVNGGDWKSDDAGDEDVETAGGIETETDDGFTLVSTSNSAITPRPTSRMDNTATKSTFDSRSLSSKTTQSTHHQRQGSSTTMAGGSTTSDPDVPPVPTYHHSRDTHFYQSSIIWRKFDEAGEETIVHKLDVSIPISTFPGEVGDYSLLRLVNLFSKSTASVTGPQHPHLHSNGAQTHPLIVLFNALVTQKRIIFLGHGRPAVQVARYVLAACAFGSGCGAVLRGFTNRAFPYTNLTNHSVMMSVPGFIAGVTNPIYESTPGWDILCNIETGKITVNKDIRSPTANASLFPQPPGMPRQPSTGAVGSDEDLKGPMANGTEKPTTTTKAGDNYDSMFIEELQGLNEQQIRYRVTEYVQRFVQLAARHEEDTFGSTAVGFPSSNYSDGQLGSGTILDDHKELSISLGRIEGWRRSVSYDLCKLDFAAQADTTCFPRIDLGYQISRLRMGRFVPDAEVQTVMQMLSNTVRTYDQVVELLSHLSLQSGGLLPIGFGLFHPISVVRDQTVDLFNIIRSFKIGVQFLQHLNAFHRMAYVRLAFTREVSYQSPINSQNNGLRPPAASISRTSSNLSSLSVGAG
ncbi:spindle pole body interacting protein [Clavulina sp. PMI_390]|nr:spindle pole body interacting protein [Clavulina sp. PMI_390]